MKKILALSASLFLVLFTNAQNPNSNANAQWRINGNSASTTDFIGTTNLQPLIFKTNNIERLKLDGQGKLLFNSGKEMIINEPGLIRLENTNPISAYMLKVGGSGHFEGEINTRQLFVQEYITFLKSMKGPRIDVDTIRMDSTRGIFGHTKIFGDVQIKQNLEVAGDISTTSLSFGTPTDKLLFTTIITPEGARVGGLGSKGPILMPASTCMSPFITGDLQQTHRFTITNSSGVTSSNMLDFKNDGSNGFIDYGYDISLHPIPREGETLLPIPALKLNSVCYGDVEIAKGGGFVSAGKYFEIGNPARDSKIASNILASDKIGQRIIANSSYPLAAPNQPAMYNTQLFVNRNTFRALSVFNTITNTNGDETFSVYGDGKVQLNSSVKANKYFVINDVSTTGSPVEAFSISGNGYTQINVSNPSAMDNVIDVLDLSTDLQLFRVKSNGHVFAREVEIKNTALRFPDYVFAKEYKLLSLSDVEKYISKNNHLPGFEKADYYEKNGIKSSEMFVKQQEKIEELTLYIIELEKRMKAIEESIKH